MGWSARRRDSHRRSPVVRLRETALAGAFLVDIESLEDERGTFARLYSREALEEAGLSVDFDYCAISENRAAGTLRGLHIQSAPHQEAKLIWCLRGRVFDVIVDLRPASKTHRLWFSAELGPHGPLLYVPRGVAHGFQTLEDDSALQYHISAEYEPESASGIRWDDPTLAIPWPIRPPTVISERDSGLPRL
ncbi:MAG: dTDP-4-dehydrorhamnose 3,5-epimerase family protein [Chloroflexi bacterium]|nr:dTDP-4-dehydrorhamnose 3,5-epimerase family protein [Chloroflexota bacterium]